MPRPARRRRTMAKAVSPMGSPSATSGTSRDSATASLATPRMVIMPRATPRKWLPLSPMKVRAGLKLKTRKPAQQPISAPVRTITSLCAFSVGPRRLIAASSSTPATIVTTPAATPSTPSSRLIEVCMPTNQTTVTGSAMMERLSTLAAWPPGSATKVIAAPTAKASTPAPTSMESLAYQGRSRMSSMAMATVITPVMATICQRVAMAPPKAATPAANPTYMARPPRRGVGAEWMRRSSRSGWSTAPRPIRRASSMLSGTTTMHTTLARRKGGSAGSQGAEEAVGCRAIEPLGPVRQREAAAQGEALPPDPFMRGGIVEAVQHGAEHVGDLVHLGGAHAARRHRRRAQADAVGVEGRAPVIGERVAVDGDAHLVERVLHRLALELVGSQVDEHEVVVGAAADQDDVAPAQPGGERLGVGHHVGCVLLEFRLHALVQHHRLGGDGVVVRAALGAGEHRLVDRVGVLGLAEDHAAPGTAHRLVGGEGDEVRMRHRARMRTAGHQPGEVGHVDQQVRTDLPGDAGEGLEVEDAGIGAVAGDDHLRPHLAGALPDGVHVEALGLLVDRVRLEVVEAAAEVDRRAVGEVAAVVEAHAQHGVAGLEDGHVDRHVGARPAVRLDVGVLRAEELLGPVDGQLLDLVDHLAAAVVATPRVPLGILVVEPRAERLQHRRGGDVLAGDELQGLLLAAQLLVEQVGHGGVHSAHGGLQRGVDQGDPSRYGLSSASPRGPARRMRGGMTLQSMIVEACPAAGPPSRTASISRPRVRSTSAAVVAGGPPCRLALVEASGPVRASSSRVRLCAGTRTMIVSPWRGMAGCFGGLARTTRLRAPGQKRVARRRAVGSRVPKRSASSGVAARRLSSSPGGRRLIRKIRSAAAPSSGWQARP